MSDSDAGWFKTPFMVLKSAATDYGKNFGGRMAAALSFRTVFAITPLLVIAVSIAGFVVGSNREARTAIIDAVTEVGGSELSDLMEGLLDSALASADTAAIVGVVVLLWSSSTLFLELQRSLNQIFEIPIPFEGPILAVAVQRLVGVLWTVGIGISLTALFAVNAATQIAGSAISRWLNMPIAFVGLLGFVVAFTFMILMFGLVFQTLTLSKLPWKPVWVGAVFTATSFSVAGYLTGFYFAVFSEPTALGVSGSIVILLFLAYLLSSVFLYGAVVTQSYRRLVYERDDSHIFFTDGREGPVREGKAPPLPVAALITFLIGLIAGWRRSK
ncbi:MAG: YihY/virulence factor BrkB family protein [Acidimicrobiia bacterium]